MKKRLIYIIGVFLLLLSPVLSQAQISYQYWIDDNKEAAVNGTTTDGTAFSLSIDAAELTTGVHFLNMRAREGKKWGTVYRKLFAIPRPANDASADLKGYEYWIDNDYANRVSAKASGSSRTATFSVDASSLSTGIHFFNMRVQDANGQWGTVKRQLFCIPREQQTDADKLITGYRYGFDDALTTVTLDTPVSEYTLTKQLDVPYPPQPVVIDDDCHFSFSEGEATLLRNVEMSFILTFTDQSKAMGSPVGTSFTVTDIQTTDILKFNVPGSQIISAHASGGYTVTQFDITSTGTYILKSTATCSLRLYSEEGEFINGITSEGLTAGYPKELEVGTYYAVAFGNATETTLSVNPDDPSLITVATPVFSYEGDVITITTATPNATIYYTLDGTDPTEESLVYTEPFTVTDNCTITAIAKRDGYYDSEISSLMVDWIVVGTPCGYAIFDSETNTLTFKYGIMPEGDNVWETDNTGTTFPSWLKPQIQSVVFESSYAQARPTSTYRWFSGFSKLTKITGIENLNTSQVTNMGYMFWGCSGLTSLNVSGFNTSKVTNMSFMFHNCRGLTSLDVSNFNTENVTNMYGMFENCSGLTSLNVSGFNTENVTNMYGMFWGCSGLTSLNVSGFNTLNVTSMGFMFYNCNGLTSLNLSNFNTSNVTTMEYMFACCFALTSLDVSRFNTSKVKDMQYMFYFCRELTSLDVSSFDTSNVTEMGWMFCNCGKLTSLNLSNFNTENVTWMASMFNACYSLENLDISSFNTGKVTNMNCMFIFCHKLTKLNLSHFDTSNVTDMGYMFNYCNDLTNLDVCSFNTSKVENMRYMFSECNNLETLDLSSFDTGNVADMDSVFYSMGTKVYVSYPTLSYGFGFDLDASKLKKIYVSDKWNTGKVTSSSEMFLGCTNLVGGKGTTYNPSHVDKAYARIDGGTAAPGYFTEKIIQIMGDVNGDGVVDVADAVETVNYILGNASTIFNKSNADMNSDGKISVFDVTAIINIILSGSDNPATSRMLEQDDETLESVYLRTNNNTVLLGIDDAARFTAFQFDVEVPQDVELTGVDWNAPTDSHLLQFVKTGDNRYMVVALSMTSTPLSSWSDTLLKLRLSDKSSGMVSLDNIIFVTPQGEKIRFNSNGVNMTTGIQGITSAQNDQVYDLSGRRLNMKPDQLPKGVYIINRKKVVIK